jgi:ring-1,2-phenylacetyl-CoA epoxidase subunit PaaC
MNKQTALFKYMLRLGDQSLIHGHRLSEWCGKGPTLEEDLALTNMALDYIGRARAFLGYAAQLEGKSRTEDDLAYKRGEREFQNYLICELPVGDFAFTMARQLLLSSYEYFLFMGLCQSEDKVLADISNKVIKEVRYHWTHSRDWCYRLGKGTSVSHDKLQQAFDDLWMYTAEFFEMDLVDYLLTEAGIVKDLNELKSFWNDLVMAVLKESDIRVPSDTDMQTGSKRGLHTEHLGHLLAEMQYLPRAYSDAVW